MSGILYLLKSMSLPLSIIIPVRNGASALNNLLGKICGTSLSRDLFEVLVVDNNSTENIEAVTNQFGVTYLKEEELQSPAAARNKGIQNAAGKVLVLVDSDCLPTGDWVRSLMAILPRMQCDLLAGAVHFELSSRKKLSEICDSITYLQQEEVVKRRNLAFTTHLLVKREVFNAIGLFNTKLYSSEDIEFVRRATAAGFKLEFSSEISVLHPAREGWALLKKAFRIGYGKGQLKRIIGVEIETKMVRSIWKRPQIQNLFPSILKTKLERVGIQPSIRLVFSLQTLLVALLSLNALGAMYGRYSSKRS